MLWIGWSNACAHWVSNMDNAAILSQLITWTPFLLEGFGWNILIALSATVIGTALGSILATLRLSSSPKTAHASTSVAATFYKLPTLAIMFYAAVLIPQEFQLPGTESVYPFPNWVKATLALSVAQVGFTAHNLTASIKFWRKGEKEAALLFVPNWGSNLLITIIASSSASLVGVSELVSRCNKVINASASTDLMIPIYLYASLFFLSFCYPLTLLMKHVKHVLTKRHTERLPSIAELPHSIVE